LIQHPNNFLAFKVVLFVFVGACIAYAETSWLHFALILGTFLALSLFCWFKKFTQSKRFFLFGSLFLFFGYAYVSAPILFRDDTPVLGNDINVGLVKQKESKVGKRDKLYVHVLGLQDDALLFIKDAQTINVGDTVVFTNKLYRLFDIKNPQEFDYKNYLVRKGIHYSSVLDSGTFTVLKSTEIPFYNSPFTFLREKIEEKLKPYLNEEAAALVFSIILGDRAGLSPELQTHFSKTGLMHLLAVSGLHLGIFIGVLRWFFSLGRLMTILNPRLRFVILLCILWFYALLTGFSPSIQRASVLFSFLLLHDLWPEKRKNTLNLLAASALVLFLINPYCLQEVGFQYSYLAVIGIICLAQPISKRIYIPNKILKWFFELLVVSFAAQLFTSPLALYYFGNFPSYFLLSNVLVLPLGIALVIIGALSLFTIFITPIVPFIGFVLQNLAAAIITCTKFLSSLPSANVFFPFSKTEMLLSLGFLVLLILTLVRSTKWTKLLLFAYGLNLGIILCFPINHLMRFMSIKSEVVLSYEKGRVLSASPVMSENKGAKYAYFFSKPAEEIQDLVKQKEVLCFQTETFSLLQIAANIILVLKDSLYKTKMPVDYLVLAKPQAWNSTLENYKGALLLAPNVYWDSTFVNTIKQKTQAHQLVDLRNYAFMVSLKSKTNR